MPWIFCWNSVPTRNSEASRFAIEYPVTTSFFSAFMCCLCSFCLCFPSNDYFLPSLGSFLFSYGPFLPTHIKNFLEMRVGLWLCSAYICLWSWYYWVFRRRRLGEGASNQTSGNMLLACLLRAEVPLCWTVDWNTFQQGVLLMLFHPPALLC